MARASRLAPLRALLGTLRVESLGVLVALAAVMSLLSEFFLTPDNLFNILLATATIGLLAIGATLVISSAGLDLSLGSVLGLSGIAGAYVAVNIEAPWYLAVLAALGTGALCGLFSGTVITRTGIPAFIVTLGMLGIARGLALVVSDGRSIYGLPPELVYLGQGRPLGIPVPAIILILAAFLMHFVLAHTRFGSHTLALGDNEAAARATGVKVERLRVSLYCLSGLMAGMAGLVFMARVNAGDPTAGLNYELTAITAAIIGGTNLFGGRGSILGALVGALIMGVLQNGLNLLAIQPYYQQMAIGAILILAVYLDRVQARQGT